MICFFQHACSEVICQKSFSHAGKIEQSALPGNVNLTYAECRWFVDPSVAFIEGSVLYNFIALENDLSTLSFDLSSPMQVDSVIASGETLQFNHQGNILNITLPHVADSGESGTLTIFYHGSPVATGNGSFVATDHSGTPIVQTLSEPYGARDWWPCRQDLNDKIDSLDIFVTSPAEYRTASAGILISEDTSAGHRTCQWKTRYPVTPYLVGIAVTNYAVDTDLVVQSNGDTVPIFNYLYPENFSTAIVDLEKVSQIMHLYDSLTIPYPFSKEKYGHAQFNWGGGMEHQTMSFVSSFSEELLAHECAHQWFGDAVTCGSWHDIWLNEGFATYFAALVIENRSKEDFIDWLRGNLSSATSISSGSVYCSDTTSISRIFSGTLSYRRAAALIHMLRWKVGDTNFFNGLISFLSDTSLAYGFARTENLQYHMELSSQMDLDQFFSEWYYREGFPSYRVEWESSETVTRIEISQRNPEFYHIPVPLLLSDGIRDTIVICEPSVNGQSFFFEPGFKVTRLVLDPEVKIISGSNVIIQSMQDDEIISVYPNIISDKFTVTANKASTFLTGLKIFSSSGKLIMSYEVEAFNPQNEFTIHPVSGGVYILEIETNNGIFRKRVIIRN